MKSFFRPKPEFLIFLSWLIIYFLTASKNLSHGDTGEFLAVAAIAGVPHEPGYPLYSLISRMVYLLPLGHPAWQVNALSGLFAAITLVFVYKIIRLLTQNTASALFGTLALAVFESFWFYALVAEVHTLQVLIISAIIYNLISAIRQNQSKYLLYSSVIFGLGLANNLTIVFTLPGFVITFWYFKKQLTPKTIILFILASLLGLLFYAYTLFASSQNPLINWGSVHDLAGLSHVLFRKDFGSFFLGFQEPPAPLEFHSFIFYCKSLFQSSWYLLPFLFLSYKYFKKNPYIYGILLINFILFGLFYYTLINTPVRSVIHQANMGQYFAYSYLFFSLLAGLGQNIIPKKYYSSVLIILFFTIPFIATFNKVRLDNTDFVDQVSKLKLSSFPQNAVLLTWSDSLYVPSQYQQHLNKFRPDIKIIQLGMLNISWYRSEIAAIYPELMQFIDRDHINYQLICKNLAPKGLLFFYPWYREFSSAFSTDCTLIPFGLVVKIIPSQEVPPIDEIIAFNDSVYQNLFQNTRPELLQKKSVRSREELFYLSEHLNFTGIYYQDNGRLETALSVYASAWELSPDQTNSILNASGLLYAKGDYQQAISVLKTGISRNPSNYGLYKNLGLTYLRIPNEAEAYRNLKKYLHFSPDDSDLQNLTRFISTYERKLR